MSILIDDLVPDELWTLWNRCCPPGPGHPPYSGRHRTISDRACFAAIVYMARISTPWRLLPARELGCGSPATCWRQLTEWAKAGVFDALHLKVLEQLGTAGRLDWSRASVNSASVRAKRGGPRGRRSSRSQQAWTQAPASLRLRRAAPDRCGNRRRRQRPHHVPSSRGGHPADPHAGWAAAPPTRQAPRRQGIRQRGQPGLAAASWGHRTDRPAWSGVLNAAGAASLEGGAVAFLVELLAAAWCAVGTGMPAGGSRSSCWPVRSSASTGSDRQRE